MFSGKAGRIGFEGGYGADSYVLLNEKVGGEHEQN